jgi:chromosome segregation ATPase
MDTPVTNEKQLLIEIDRLREQFPHTQDLYREVCVLLFFRYGITPTANKLYQLVRKGSMTAPAEALNKFWEDLREKSRVRIEHPDLPDSLKTAAGELTATLWTAAQAAAHESLASYRSEAQASVMEAKAAITAAEAERDAAQQALEKSQQSLAQANERIGTLEQRLAAAHATTSALDAQLTQARDECGTLQQRLEDARRDFTAELDKLRADAQLADERFRAAETRALMEIDRERTAVAKLQKELDTTRAASVQAAERNRSELTVLQEQLGDLRQKAGVLEGNLQAVTAAREEMTNELASLKTRLEKSTLELAAARTETSTWRERALQAEQTVTTLQEAAKPARAPRKTKAT